MESSRFPSVSGSVRIRSISSSSSFSISRSSSDMTIGSAVFYFLFLAGSFLVGEDEDDDSVCSFA